jgi:hypothetical protein
VLRRVAEAVAERCAVLVPPYGYGSYSISSVAFLRLFICSFNRDSLGKQGSADPNCSVLTINLAKSVLEVLVAMKLAPISGFDPASE